MVRGRTKLPLGLVYDTGALIAAEANDRRMWAVHARALQRGVVPVVPAGCVVEAWRGTKQAGIARLLDGCEVEALTLDHAKRAGVLLRGISGTGAGPNSGGDLGTGSAVVGPIDATVAETAIRRGCAAVTSDRGDIEQLSSGARRRIQIIDI